MSAAEKTGVMIVISAVDPEEARELFDRAMGMIETGEKFTGQLIPSSHDRGGYATLTTQRPHAGSSHG